MKLNASARIMQECAVARGFEVATFDDRHLLKISKGDKWFYTRGSRHSRQSSVGMTIADYKDLTRQVLEKIGVPMAKGGVFRDLESGLKFASIAGYPLVYKPARSRHGVGVVVGIESDERLAECIRSGKNGDRFILETKLSGSDFRVVVVGYKMVAASKRLPAFVDGDGVLNIEELVNRENKNPVRMRGHQGNLSTIEIDKLVIENLQSDGKNLEYVPERGERVFLRKTAGLSTGGVGIDVTESVGEENRKMFEQMARECDLSTVGIDLMADDLERPIGSQVGAGVMELNASPGLRMHHYPYQGKQRDVAGTILDFVFGAE